MHKAVCECRCPPAKWNSVRGDTCGLDDLAPLLGFHVDEFAEIRGRARNHRSAEVSNAHFSGVGYAGVALPIERVDDVGGRVLGCADAGPSSEPHG
jgi:hypothetical protein